MKGLKYILIGILICIAIISGYLIGKNSIKEVNKNEQIIDLLDYLPEYNMSKKEQKVVTTEEQDKNILEEKAEEVRKYGIDIDSSKMDEKLGEPYYLDSKGYLELIKKNYEKLSEKDKENLVEAEKNFEQGNYQLAMEILLKTEWLNE
jgi:hypothetical protein